MEPENPPVPQKTFEECLPIILREIEKRRPKWRLTSIQYMDFSDVANILLKHVFVKWEKYDQSRPLNNWLHGLLGNQIRNLIRNNFAAWKRPCLTCPFFGGSEICTLHGIQSSICADYDRWFKTKRLKLEILMPHSIDLPKNTSEGDTVKIQLEDRVCNFLDFETKIPEFNNLLKQKLRPLEWKAYTLLFIDHLTDLQAARSMGYSVEGSKNSVGYKTIAKLKTSIYKKSLEVVKMIDF